MNHRAKILIAAGVVLIAGVLIPVIHHYQLRAATEAYIAQLKAQGEPMELAQVIPPPVPPEQNSADTFRKAVELINTDTRLDYTNYAYGMKMIAPGKAIVCWRQPDVRDSDGTNSWESIKAAISQNSQSFALLHQIIASPNFDFQINYDRGVADLNFTNLYLAESKQAVQRLETAALCNLHRGNTASAVTNLRAMLAIVKALRNERLVISELVRIAIAQITLTANWEVLQSTNLTDGELTELQNDWANLDFVQGQENALEMERVTGEITLAKLRSSNTELLEYFNLSRTARESMGLPKDDESLWDRTKLIAEIFMWHYWWSYPDELRAQKGYEVLLDTERFAKTNHSFQTALQHQGTKLDALGMSKVDDEILWVFTNEMDFHSVLSQSITVLSGAGGKVMRVEAARQVVTTAIALKRYQLKHGNYPPDLISLVPEFLSQIPLDPVDGQPLRYRRNSDGTFLLYSLGENGKDDGGNPALEKGALSPSYYWQNVGALDWVWPQPATPEEIKAYYNRKKP
jgi:hypothetical protein